MKAMVWQGSGEVRLQKVDDSRIEAPTDAVVRFTTTAICGADLRLIRVEGDTRSSGFRGHLGVGVVEALGGQVRNFAEGDRVVVPSSVACGMCHQCRKGWTAQCDFINHNGFGDSYLSGEGPEESMRMGLADKARVPFASFNLVKLPDGISDSEAILISDVFPTGYAGAEMASIEAANSVAVIGCGPVGLFAVASARLMGAGRILAVDSEPERLVQARRLGAETIDAAIEDPVDVVKELTGGIGVDRAIETSGFKAGEPGRGPNGHDVGGKPAAASLSGDERGLKWIVEMLAKQGVASIIGRMPASAEAFPIGLAYERNLTIRAGAVHHRMVIPHLIDLVLAGRINPLEVVAPTMETRLDRLEEEFRVMTRVTTQPAYLGSRLGGRRVTSSSG